MISWAPGHVVMPPSCRCFLWRDRSRRGDRDGGSLEGCLCIIDGGLEGVERGYRGCEKDFDDILGRWRSLNAVGMFFARLFMYEVYGR